MAAQLGLVLKCFLLFISWNPQTTPQVEAIMLPTADTRKVRLRDVKSLPKATQLGEGGAGIHAEAEIGMVVPDCNPSIGRQRQEDHKLQASMGYLVRPYLQRKNKMGRLALEFMVSHTLPPVPPAQAFAPQFSPVSEGGGRWPALSQQRSVCPGL